MRRLVVETVLAISLSISLVPGLCASPKNLDDPTGTDLAERARPPVGYPAEVVFDDASMNELGRAWSLAKNGVAPLEGVVLLYRMVNGSYRARSLGATHEYKRFTFKWDPAAIAIIHTHPNSVDPRPTEADERLAMKLGVPVLTITRAGLFLYCPCERRTTKLMEGLSWLQRYNWTLELLSRFKQSANGGCKVGARPT